jgi:acetyl-CoA carboxylase biotin carboxyl carrier protein
MKTKGHRLEGRRNARELEALSASEGSAIAVGSPGVGIWHPLALPGHVVVPGDVIGELDVLGQVARVIAPDAARGAVIEALSGRARTAVSWGQRLYLLDPSGGGASVDGHTPTTSDRPAASGLVFTAPTSGRFYSRPGPGKAPFVADGDVVRDGMTVCMLEVMKTFNRVTYGGPGLPAQARVVAVRVADEADVAQGDVILELEALP